MKRFLSLMFLTATFSACAQVVNNSDAVITQLNLNRDENGFKSCGIRVVTAVMDTKSSSFAYDFSINLWQDALGMMKAGQQSIPFDKSKGWDLNKLSIKKPGPESFWIAKRDENVTLKPVKYIKSDDPGYVMGGADGGVATKMIFAIMNGEPMQVALHFPKDRYDQIISFKTSMSEDDQASLQACFAGLVKRIEREGSPKK